MIPFKFKLFFSVGLQGVGMCVALFASQDYLRQVSSLLL